MNYSLVQICKKFRDFFNNLQLNKRETRYFKQLVLVARILAVRHLLGYGMDT